MMHVRYLAPLLLVLALAACGPSIPPSAKVTEQPATPPSAPIWAETVKDVSLQPIDFIDGEAVLVVEPVIWELADSQYAALHALKVPACWGPEGDRGQADCPRSFPVPAEAAAMVPPAPTKLSMLTTTGLCVPKLGALQVYRTDGCDFPMTVGFPLSACAVDGPHFGFIGELPAELSWVPMSQDQREQPPVVETGSPEYRAAVTAWYGDFEKLRGDDPMEVSSRFDSLQLTHESFEMWRASGMIDQGECNVEDSNLREAYRRQGEKLERLEGLLDLTGAVALQGFSLLLVEDDGWSVRVWARTATGFEQHSVQSYFRDNEECRPYDGVEFEYPCAP